MTRTPTLTPTQTPTRTVTITPTITPTRSATSTRTPTRTVTPSATPKPTTNDAGPVITFLVVGDNQGCFICPGVPGCICNPLTPTATPMSDAQGRPIFLVGPDGRFRLVVEGTTGASGSQPGTRLREPPAFPDGRPDLQAEASMPMGNGNSVVVDCTSSPNLDGIDAVDPPNFGAGASTTSALKDFSCRFAGNSVNTPCLLDSNGLATLGNPGAGPLVQFCDDVAAGQAFRTGDTLVTVRLRDGALNLGPPEQIIVRVPP